MALNLQISYPQELVKVVCGDTSDVNTLLCGAIIYQCDRMELILYNYSVNFGKPWRVYSI